VSELTVREFTGAVAELHALPMPTEGVSTELWLMRPFAPAVAMGSAQRAEQFDEAQLAADQVALAARRSGGGAVFIDPSAVVWIDVVAPRTSALWSSELVENFMIVGRCWHRALVSLGVETELMDHSLGRTDAASLACWAGLGWGELVVGGAKVVGLSQRRTRWGARVQAMAVLDDSAAQVARYLSLADRHVVDGSIVSPPPGLFPAGIDAKSIENAVVDALAKKLNQA